MLVPFCACYPLIYKTVWSISNTPRYVHTLETHYRYGVKMARIRNGKVLARKLSTSEGWNLFAEVFSRNLQFGITWKYESRLFGCRNMLSTHRLLKWQTSTHTESQREMRLVKWDNTAKRENLFPTILRNFVSLD